jgi:hypothetical protein
MNGANYVVFHTATDDSYMNSSRNFRGADVTGNTEITVYFASATSDHSGSYDSVALNITAGKEVQVMEALAGAMAGSRKHVTVVADDINSVYCHDNITSCGAITVLGGAVENLNNVTADTQLYKYDSGKVFVWSDAAATITLPDSGAGDMVGWTAKFISGTVQGTGQKVVTADTSNEDLIGMIMAVDNDDSNATKAWPSLQATGNASVNFNSVAQGHPGSFVIITNVAADVWHVEGKAIQSGGSEATPFATS